MRLTQGGSHASTPLIAGFAMEREAWRDWSCSSQGIIAKVRQAPDNPMMFSLNDFVLGKGEQAFNKFRIIQSCSSFFSSSQGGFY